MIKSNAAEVAKSLEQMRALIDRKLRNMVSGFVYQLTVSLSENTPVGDPLKWPHFYEQRFEAYGISPNEGGFHAGSWQYSENVIPGFDPNIYSQVAAGDNNRRLAKTQYKLGDTFYIGSNSPAIINLEENYSVQTNGLGIVKPSIAQLMSAYGINMKNYYKEG